MHKACEWYGCVRLDKDAEIVRLKAENERLNELVETARREVALQHSLWHGEHSENKRLKNLLGRIVKEAEDLREALSISREKDGWDPIVPEPCILEAQEFLRGEGE